MLSINRYYAHIYATSWGSNERIRTHIHTCKFIHTHVNLYKHIYKFIHTHKNTHIQIYTHTCKFIHTHMQTYTHTNTHIYTHTNLYTHKHTYTYKFIHTETYKFTHIYLSRCFRKPLGPSSPGESTPVLDYGLLSQKQIWKKEKKSQIKKKEKEW